MNPAIQIAPVQESATLIAWSLTVSQTFNRRKKCQKALSVESQTCPSAFGQKSIVDPVVGCGQGTEIPSDMAGLLSESTGVRGPSEPIEYLGNWPTAPSQRECKSSTDATTQDASTLSTCSSELTSTISGTEWLKDTKDASYLVVPYQCPITRYNVNEKKDSSCSTFRTKPAASLFDLPVCEITSHAVSPHSLTIIGGELQNKLSARVLSRLAEAETREPDAWLRDDYRIAWLTVLHCAEGIADPWRFAFWKYLGKTPEKLIPLFVERRENHRAMEIPDYDPTLRRRA